MRGFGGFTQIYADWLVGNPWKSVWIR